MMMHVILAAFLFCCGVAVSATVVSELTANMRRFAADETASHFAPPNARILHSAPVFEKIFETVTVEEAEALEVLCSAISDQPITYKWLDPDENEVSSDKNQLIYTFLTDDGSHLFISNASIRHQGAYICIATDEQGLTSKFFNIRVKEKSRNESGSGLIVRVVEDVKNNSISFKIHTIGSVEKIFVNYSEIMAPENFTSLEWKFRGLGPYEVTDLIASGKYSFQFRLSESDAWSKTYTYVMLPEMPHVIVDGLGDGSLNIEWFSTLDDRLRQTIDKHELFYYTISQFRGSYWEKSDCGVTIEIPRCKRDSYTITSLDKSSYYEIRLRAHTSEGYGEPYYFRVKA